MLQYQVNAKVIPAHEQSLGPVSPTGSAAKRKKGRKKEVAERHMLGTGTTWQSEKERGFNIEARQVAVESAAAKPTNPLEPSARANGAQAADGERSLPKSSIAAVKRGVGKLDLMTQMKSRMAATYDESGYFRQQADNLRVVFSETMGRGESPLREGVDYVYTVSKRPDTRWVLDPGTKFMSRWDLLMMVLLLFTAFVTPFEVAFLETDWNILFWINRVIDLCFLGDLIINFMLPYPIFLHSTKVWMVSSHRIAKRYLFGWFIVDVISILPYDVLALTGSGDSSLKMLRIVRCMRLLKIVKILKSFKKLEKLKERAGVKFSTTKLVQFSVVLVAVSHWLSCLWMIVATMEAASTNWVTAYFGVKHGGGRPTPAQVEKLDGCEESALSAEGLTFCHQGDVSISQLYLTCLYWAIMTLSTIGYGDVTPQTDAERFVAIVGMGIGAGVYAYLVGGICGILANRDPVTTEFHQTIDNLNNFMDEYDIPQAMKHKLREFCFGSKALFRARVHEGVLTALSPQLRCDVICFVNDPWVSKVVLFKQLPAVERRLFLTELIVNMSTHAYAADEYILRKQDPVSNMYIVKEGMCVTVGKGKSHKVVVKFGVVGEDVMVRTLLRSPFDLKTVMFSVLCMMKKEDIAQTLAHPRFTATRTYLRRVAMFKIFKDGFLRFADAFKRKYCRKGMVAFNPEVHRIKLNEMGELDEDEDDDDDDGQEDELATTPATMRELANLRHEMKAQHREVKKWITQVGLIIKSRGRM